MKYDTLQPAGGSEKSLKDWGFELSSCVGERRSQAPDTWRGVVTTLSATDDPLFAFEQEVTVRTGRDSASGSPDSFSGGTTKFVGVRVQQSGRAPSRGSSHVYEFQNARYFLDNAQYKQQYQGLIFGFFPGENVLFTGLQVSAGATVVKYITVGEQLADIFNFAAASGASLQVGTIDPATYFPSLICKAQECSQAIDKCLELFPRTNEMWDYSTSPPTVSVRFVDNLPSVTLPLFTGPSNTGPNHKDLDICRRDDLVARAVVITYRITNTSDSVTSYDYAVDQWGPVMEAAYQAALGGGVAAANAAAQSHSAKAYFQPAFMSYIGSHPGDSIGACASGRAAVAAAVLAGNCDPDQGVRVPSELIDLAGFRTTSVQGTLDVEPLAARGGTVAARRAWWASKRGGELSRLVDSRIRFPDGATGLPDAKLFYASAGFDSAGVAVSAGQELTTADYSFYSARIVRGAHCPWMNLSDGTPVRSVKVRATCKMVPHHYDVPATGDALDAAPSNEAASDAATNGNRVGKPNVREEHALMEITNGVSGPYSTAASSQPGESYILGVAPALGNGVARYLWLALRTPQYEGEYIKVESNFANDVGPDKRLNLSGGRAEWATMNAQIIAVTENYGTKETSVSIGPAKHLSSQQLSSMLNMWRTRQPWYNPACRAAGSANAGGVANMPVSVGPANTATGVENPGQVQHVDYSTPGDPTSPPNGIINSDPAAIHPILAATTPTPVAGASADSIKTLQPRETAGCDESGDLIFYISHRGDGYTKS